MQAQWETPAAAASRKSCSARTGTGSAHRRNGEEVAEEETEAQ